MKCIAQMPVTEIYVARNLIGVSGFTCDLDNGHTGSHVVILDPEGSPDEEEYFPGAVIDWVG